MGCARAAPVSFVGPEAPSWHVGAQRCFPQDVGDWQLVAVRRYANPHGEDYSYSYRGPDGLATFYIYPRVGEPPEEHSVEQVELAVASNHVQGVEWTEAGYLRASAGDGRGPYSAGIQASSRPANGSPAGTLAAVWTAGDWFLKLRLTWTPPDAPWRGPLGPLLRRVAFPCEPGDTPPTVSDPG